jgi:hypothetical protein
VSPVASPGDDDDSAAPPRKKSRKKLRAYPAASAFFEEEDEAGEPTSRSAVKEALVAGSQTVRDILSRFHALPKLEDALVCDKAGHRGRWGFPQDAGFTCVRGRETKTQSFELVFNACAVTQKMLDSGAPAGAEPVSAFFEDPEVASSAAKEIAGAFGFKLKDFVG